MLATVLKMVAVLTPVGIMLPVESTSGREYLANRPRLKHHPQAGVYGEDLDMETHESTRFGHRNRYGKMARDALESG